jgi:hypothetical protein
MPRIGAPEDYRLQGARGDDGAGAMAAHSRTLRNSIVSLAIFFALVVALLLGVPGLRSAADHISDANILWVLAGVGLELVSCAGYVVLFVLTSAVNVAAVVVIGVPMWLGLLFGSTNPRLTLLPAGAALVTIVGTLGLASWARRVASGERLDRGRVAVALRALGDGVHDAVRLIGEHDWRLIGSVAFLRLRREIGDPAQRGVSA